MSGSQHMSRFAALRPSLIVPALFVLALGLRAALMLTFPQQPFSDGEFYMLRAAEMARGMGYQEAGHPTAFWPVGYPAMLTATMMLFGPGMIGPMLLNLAAAALILWLVMWFARALGGGQPAARWAGFLYALYPAHIAYTGTPLSETVSTAVTMAAFALLLRWRLYWVGLIAAGAMFGLATLMRAQAMLIPTGVIILMLIAMRGFDWRAAIRAAIAIHITLFAIVLPWSLRNQDQLGSFVLVSTNGGTALLTGANDYADGGYMNVEHSPLWAEVGIPFDQRVERQVELDARQRDMAKAWIAQNPGRWLAIGVRKVALVWSKDSDGFWGLSITYPDRAPLWTALQIANLAFYALLLLLAAITGWTALRGLLRRDPATAPLILLYAMPVFVSLTAFGFSGQIRYHYPAMPFVIVAAGYALALLTKRSATGLPSPAQATT